MGFFGLLVALSPSGCGGGEEAPISSATSKYEVAEDEPNAPVKPAPPETGGKTAGQPCSRRSGRQRGFVPGLGGQRAGRTGLAARRRRGGRTDVAACRHGYGGVPSQLPEGQQALMALLEDLVKRQPEGETQQQLIADHQRLNSARLQAANKLLAIAQDQQVQMAVIQVELNAMWVLAQLGNRRRRMPCENTAAAWSETPTKTRHDGCDGVWVGRRCPADGQGGGRAARAATAQATGGRHPR